jgi:hypothetical protein
MAVTQNLGWARMHTQNLWVIVLVPNNLLSISDVNEIMSISINVKRSLTYSFNPKLPFYYLSN